MPRLRSGSPDLPTGEFYCSESVFEACSPTEKSLIFTKPAGHPAMDRMGLDLLFMAGHQH